MPLAHTVFAWLVVRTIAGVTSAVLFVIAIDWILGHYATRHRGDHLDDLADRQGLRMLVLEQALRIARRCVGSWPRLT